MATGGVRVTLTPDGFYPQALRWQGRGVRVLYVEETYTRGLERRYRVRTPEGLFELGLNLGTGGWLVRRAPTWYQRLCLRIGAMPRYPAAVGRRRRRSTADLRAPRAGQAATARPAWSAPGVG